MEPLATTPMPPPDASDTPAKAVYALYLASLVLGVTLLVGVVVAYVYQGEAPDWLKAHYRFQIRTFWIGLLYGLVGLLLSFIFVGLLVFAFLAVWLIVRCVKGLQRMGRHEPIPDPATWLW